MEKDLDRINRIYRISRCGQTLISFHPLNPVHPLKYYFPSRVEDLLDNLSIYIAKPVKLISLTPSDQLGNHRPNNGKGDIGAIEK